jgi:O-antigen ligase
MAAAAIMSTSRAGAIVTVLISVLAALAFAATHASVGGGKGRHGRALTLHALAMFFIGALALGFALGWKALGPRLAELNDGFEGREQMYAAARPMADDFPVFGTGPGSFETVSQLYPRPDIFWPAQLHNDWLETRITFGWVGSGLIALAFLCVILRWWSPGGIHGGRRFVILTWLAMGGCMLHARFDFPFQIHSTLFLFLLWCGTLSTLSRRPGEYSRSAMRG